MTKTKYPSLYQINTRVWLTDLATELGRPATLDDIPDKELDRFQSMGFDWIWFLSVWSTGEGARKVSLQNSEWRHEFEETLPDLKDEDIGGSGFAITGYQVHSHLGGDAALKRLRTRLTKRGLKLMLDFVPNHMAPDHPWVQEHPDYFVSGTEDDLKSNPKNYTRLKVKGHDKILAYGRDPYFAGWPDTVQLDYSNPDTVEAMKQELVRISGQCDGVRCDMAMLILPEVFERTWGRRAHSFWPEVTKAVHEHVPNFCFMAEVYWDMEWTLQQQGFDYTYDKRLYDRLCEGHVKPIREHFHAGLDYQDKLARFLENHDEPRIAKTMPLDKHKAAAVITFCSPGLRFFHQGQLEGRIKRISPHLIRAPRETINKEIHKFYVNLLAVIRVPFIRDGKWQLLECTPAWDGNGSSDAFVAHSWIDGDERMVIVVNYSSEYAQCYLRLPFTDLSGTTWRLKDLMSEATYDREGNDLQQRGLYLDLKPWQFHAFEMKRIVSKT